MLLHATSWPLLNLVGYKSMLHALLGAAAGTSCALLVCQALPLMSAVGCAAVGFACEDCRSACVLADAAVWC